MQIAQQLHAAGLAIFPCGADKSPACEKWKETALLDPSTLNWPSDLVGVPVPPGVVVIDLDTYKGVTREQVEAHLGCSLPWDQALIQTTARGGQHYAFRTMGWDVRQGSNIGIDGLDTRCSGRGYICTGGGYAQAGTGGIYLLAHPQALPALPEATRHELEQVERSAEHKELPAGDKDVSAVQAALSRIPPSVGRSEWLKVGLALRHHFHDNEQTGLTLFDQWSSGQYHPDGEPANYSADTLEGQFLSFKPEGATTIGSLYHMAVANGYVMPAHLDIAAAFGGTGDADVMEAVRADIEAFGGDAMQFERLVASIADSPLSAVQRELLGELLKTHVKGKALHKRIDSALKPTTPQGEYGKNDTLNAAVFLDTLYRDGGLRYADETWYCYGGEAWSELTRDHIKHEVGKAMTPVQPSAGAVAGAYARVTNLAHRPDLKIGNIADNLTLFQNGVLNMDTGDLYAHSKDYFTTNILPFNFNPSAQCLQWKAFLDEIFEGDAERIALLQEWFGYLIATSYRHHKILLLLGPKRCGKGTIGRIMSEVVGKENFTGGSLNSFTSDSYLDSLRTKKAVFVGDAEKRINKTAQGPVIERLKTISGNDQVTFDRKFKSTISEALPCRITMAANNVPGLFDDSGALASRLLVLPFNVTFFGREDIELAEKLLVELEGIALWALQGRARLNVQGRFTSPQASQSEMEFIQEAYSPLQRFLKDACVIDKSIEGTSSIDLYVAYKDWATGHLEDHTLGKNAFVSSLKDLTRGTKCEWGRHRYGGAQNPVSGFRYLAVAGKAHAPANAVQTAFQQQSIVEH